MVAERRCIQPLQGDLGDEAESLERGLADSKRSLAAEKALETKLVENCGNQQSKWEEGEKDRRVLLLTEDEEHMQNDTVERIVDVPVTRLLVFIMDDTDEPIPEWLNSVKSVVDSEDIPLNVCRETPRQNKILRVIKGNHVTKHSEILAEIAELLDDYEKLYEQCGKCRDHEDSAVGVKTAEVLRIDTSESGGKPIGCMEYVDRTKEDQDDISYVGGENTAVVSSSPFEENLRMKGLEERHVTDPMEEYAVYQFKESDGTKLNPTAKEGLNHGDQDNEKKHEELKTELEPLTKLMKHIVVDKVGKAMVSDRIVDSPCVLATSEYEYGCSAKIERIMETQALRDSSMTSHMVSKKNIEVNPTRSIMTELKKKASTWQQQHKSSKHQLTKQPAQREREEGKKGKSEKVEREEWETVVAKGRKGQRGRGQEGRKEEEEKEAEEGGDEQVEKDVTGWTEVTRKRRRKTVQIFVKVDGSRVTPVEVSPAEDKVEDVLKRIQKDEDVYVTMHGRVLKRCEKLKSCEVTDGCTIQVTSRLRGGGKHKDKKSKAEKRPAASAKQPEPLQMEKVLEEMVTCIVEGSDVEGEQRLQSFLATIQNSTGWEKGRLEIMECRIRQAVEEKRRENIEERGRDAEQEQIKKVRFAEEKQSEETQEQSTDKQDVMSGLEELRTGRGSRPLVRGGDEGCRADETSRKGKGKGNGGKDEHGGKGEGFGSKGKQQETREGGRKRTTEDEQQRNEEEEKILRLLGEWQERETSPIVKLAGADEKEVESTQQVENLMTDEDRENMRAMTSEEKEKRHKEDVRKLVEMVEKEEMELEMMQQEEMRHEKQRGQVAPNMGAGGPHLQATSDPREARVLSWADCKDEEETTEERPPGLEEEEEVENEPKTQQEEKPTQVESEQEAQEEERRAQEGREEERKAQEARELKRAQEAREEERKAQEAREDEEKKAQEAREEERKAQEAREDEEKKAQEAREEQRAQEGARGTKESAGGARGTKESAGSARGKEGSGRAREAGERGQGSGRVRETGERGQGSGRARTGEKGQGSGRAKRARQKSCDPGRARGRSKGPRRTRRRSEFTARGEPRVEQTHDMVAQRMVGPSQQRTTPADGARPSKSVASSHQGRAGSARDGKGPRERKGEMGAREDRKQHLARHFPLQPNSRSSCSNCSNSSPAMTQDAFSAEQARQCLRPGRAGSGVQDGGGRQGPLPAAQDPDAGPYPACRDRRHVPR